MKTFSKILFWVAIIFVIGAVFSYGSTENYIAGILF